MTGLIDITRPMASTTAVWPGDSPFDLQSMMKRADGNIVNVTRIVTSAHMGTHIDAPSHFADEVPTVEELDLNVYWGIAQVVTVNKPHGALTPADFAHVDLGRAPRLLIHSAASDFDLTLFPEQYVYPSPELADYLGSLGHVLFGSDAPSMDEMTSKDMPGHQALWRNRIMILEGLRFTAVPDGLYELVALPLKINGGDGSPVRAVLRPRP